MLLFHLLTKLLFCIFFKIFVGLIALEEMPDDSINVLGMHDVNLVEVKGSLWIFLLLEDPAHPAHPEESPKLERKELPKAITSRNSTSIKFVWNHRHKMYFFFEFLSFLYKMDVFLL